MILTLNSDAFSGSLPAPASTGISPIFRGKINIDSNSIRCYIKPLPDHIKKGAEVVDNRELVSEALGYVLAKRAGHAVPEQAGIIMLTAEQIPRSTLLKLQENTPDTHPQNDYLAWFSQDMQYPSLLKRYIIDAPEHLLDQQAKRLFTRLAASPEAPSIITFDEWTENSDRNPGNLIEIDGGRVALIDHGRLFRYPTWSPSQLETSGLPVCNVLRGWIDTHTPNWSERTRIKSARVMAYNNLAATWRTDGAIAAKQVLENFLNDEEVEQVISFLASRLDPGHYNKAVGLLALA